MPASAAPGQRAEIVEPQNLKKILSLLGAAVIGLMSLGCHKVRARIEIREANDLYGKEQYADALRHYEAARRIDPSFPDLDRLIGYSAIGMFKPDNPTPENAKHADKAIQELQRYLKKRPKDEAAREALINLLLNADRTSQAVAYFENYLKENPADLKAV
jgi:tetratricopeptide (TPR) repeat protein